MHLKAIFIFTIYIAFKTVCFGFFFNDIFSNIFEANPIQS